MTSYEIYCSLKNGKNVKDADVAKATNIGKSTFSDWKSGRSIPKQDKMQKIANFFGVSIDVLLNENETEFAGVDINMFPQQEMVKISDEAKEVALIYDTLDEQGKQAFRDLLKIVAKRP